MSAQPASPVETILCDELAHGDAVLGSLAPILGHLVATPANALFNDQVVATLRGCATFVATKLLEAQAIAAGADDPHGFARTGSEGLAAALLAEPAFLLHCHAQIIECQTAKRLQQRNSVDPVLPSLLQSLIASKDEKTAQLAMAALAGQARFMQQQQRMELPLEELPGPVFDAAIKVWREFVGAEEADHAVKAEMKLRSNFNEATARIGLLSRLIELLGKDRSKALSIGSAGISLFATALAAATGQSRQVAMLATSEQQMGRLALSLRAAGLSTAQIEEVFLHLHPETTLPEGFDALRSDRAGQLLSASGSVGAA